MKKATGYQCKQDIINAQAKEIKRLQDRINDAEEVIANAVNLINAQQEKIALLEAKMNAKEQARVTNNKAKASDNNDKLVMLNKFGYTVKDMIARTIAYEEAQKASKRIVEPDSRFAFMIKQMIANEERAKQQELEKQKAELIAKLESSIR